MFQQVRCETVPQAVYTPFLQDAGFIAGMIKNQGNGSGCNHLGLSLN